MDHDEQKNSLTVRKLIIKILHSINTAFKRWFSIKEYYTLMLVPHNPLNDVRSIRFPKLLVSIFVLFNIAAFAAVCAFAISYHSLGINLLSKRAEYQSLQHMNEINEEQLSQYKSTEDEIKQKMVELKGLQNKLKNIIESEGGKPQSSIRMPTIASRGNTEVVSQTEGLPSFAYADTYDLFSAVDNLEDDVNATIAELDEVMARAEKAMQEMRARPSAMPVYGTITSPFGYRKDPIRGDSEFHTGIDISNKEGTPVRASGDGIVVEAGWCSGYGNLVRINHKNGYESLYGHNSKIIVRAGQYVKRGQIIGYMGSTGRTTGSHCHFEVRYNGKPVNPYSLM